jgi:hypothetical protein
MLEVGQGIMKHFNILRKQHLWLKDSILLYAEIRGGLTNGLCLGNPVFLIACVFLSSVHVATAGRNFWNSKYREWGNYLHKLANQITLLPVARIHTGLASNTHTKICADDASQVCR